MTDYILEKITKYVPESRHEDIPLFMKEVPSLVFQSVIDMATENEAIAEIILMTAWLSWSAGASAALDFVNESAYEIAGVYV
jgi:hypothetical protein